MVQLDVASAASVRSDSPGSVLPLSASVLWSELSAAAEKKQCIQLASWPKYRDIHFWSYRPALGCMINLNITEITIWLSAIIKLQRL